MKHRANLAFRAPSVKKEASRVDSESHSQSVGSLAELTRRNVEVIGELEKTAQAQRSTADRIADAITGFVGSMAFVYIHVAWFALWIMANSSPVLPPAWRIDPFPYTFLTFVVSLEAIFLSTFILISQNHEERLAQRRNHLDLQINLLSEQENSQMLKMLESIERRLAIGGNGQAQPLKESTQPQQLVKQIKDVIEDDKDEARQT